MANGKVFYVHPAVPSVLKHLDPIRRKYEIEVERTVFELH